MNWTSSTRRRAVGLATIACGLAVALPTYAAQTISGTACQSMYPPNSQYGTDLQRNSEGIVNTGSSIRYVYCPLPRYNGLSSTGLSSVYVDVDDSSGFLYCIAEAHDEWGNMLNSQTVWISSKGMDRELTFHNLPSTAWGYYQVFCEMPANSTIHSVQYVEN